VYIGYPYCRVASYSAYPPSGHVGSHFVHIVLDNPDCYNQRVQHVMAYLIQTKHPSQYCTLGCSVSVMVGRQTSDREIASLVPGRCIAR